MEWSLVHDSYRPDEEGLREVLSALGNGYFVTRAASPDASDDGIHYPGTYLAGGYNRLKTWISGREVENEDLVNFPNWLPLTFKINDDRWFRIDEVEIRSYRQKLDLEAGLLTRRLSFSDQSGRVTETFEQRFVSMADQHVAGLSLEIRAVNWSGRLQVRSAIDGGVKNRGVKRYRGLNQHHLEILENREIREAILLCCRTNQSHIVVGIAARTRIYRNGEDVTPEARNTSSKTRVEEEFTLDLEMGESILVEKIITLYTSIDPAISEPMLEAENKIRRLGRFDELLAEHRLTWKHLWEDFDIELEADDPLANLKLRLHIFHLLQTISSHSIDLDVGFPARGWHGEAYRGHIFWDELFAFPFLNLHTPMLTRSLLLYRYRRLPEARCAAREAGYLGAMFPWQSGSNGREEAQRLHQNPRSGRWITDNTYRQRHINAAIAYNIWHYYQATEDHEFMYYYGAEMMLEIARLFASIARHNQEIDRYEISGIVGPDEFHTAYPKEAHSEGLNNNAYTNVLVSWVLIRAIEVLRMFPEERFRQVCERIGLKNGEIDRWDEISRKLRVPFHRDGIISQFEGYEDLTEFDWEGYLEKYGDIRRLDRILDVEGDTTNRYKASKQADVLMMFYLFSADELLTLFEHLGYPFNPEQIPENIQYYLERTSHGSTLSTVVHSWVLSRMDRRRSWHLFNKSLESDLADIQGGTTPEGIHAGAMAGTIDLVQGCYTGLEMRANNLHFNPVLPDQLHRLKFQMRYRRHKLTVEINHDLLKVTSASFNISPITISYRAEVRDLAPGGTIEFRLLKPEERDRDENI